MDHVGSATNIAKRERLVVDGRERSLLVHRKGATRAFGPGTAELPDCYRDAGQPVMIPGDMGRASYVLCGTARAMTETFGSSCHGAGRPLSRKAALRQAKGRRIDVERQPGRRRHARRGRHAQGRAAEARGGGQGMS